MKKPQLSEIDIDRKGTGQIRREMPGPNRSK